MKTLLLLLMAALSGTSMIYSQIGSSKQKDVQEIKKRTLVFALEEISPKLKEKLDENEFPRYKDEVEEYNKAIKEAAAFWKFNEKIEFMTRAEIGKLSKSKSMNHAYVEFNKFTVFTLTAASYRSLSEGEPTILNVRLTDDNPLGPPVFGVHMANPYPNKADLVYALKAMQLQLNFKLESKKDGEINDMFKENGKKLQNQTLLVNRQNTALDLEEIKKAYPYPVELVDKNRIDEAILNSDPKFPFVIVIPYSNNGFSYHILDASDCSELGRTSPDQSTGVSVTIKDDTDPTRSKLKKDHFKIFAKNVK